MYYYDPRHITNIAIRSAQIAIKTDLTTWQNTKKIEETADKVAHDQAIPWTAFE